MCMCMSCTPTEAPRDIFLSGTQPYINLVHYYNYVCVLLLQPNLQIQILNDKDEAKNFNGVQKLLLIMVLITGEMRK